MQTVRFPVSLARCKAGNKSAARMAMMAITTSNSFNVNDSVDRRSTMNLCYQKQPRFTGINWMLMTRRTTGEKTSRSLARRSHFDQDTTGGLGFDEGGLTSPRAATGFGVARDQSLFRQRLDCLGNIFHAEAQVVKSLAILSQVLA